MPLQKKSKKIGEHTYLCVQMLPLKALRMSMKLGKIISPFIKELKISGENSSSIKDMKTDEILPAIAELLHSVDIDLFEEVIVELLETCNMNGKEITNVNTDFIENPADIIKVAVLCIEVNFKAFFPKSGAISSIIEKMNGLK